ncbi:MAG TPA: DUF6636 domain-containing protein [Gaiellaceae bacterium]|nr:DUF6636 domain-containing protein [Gaiellaceae bacterium]
MKRVLVAFALVALVGASAAYATPLPGVKSPTRNISCFYVPIKPTTRGNLLCAIAKSSYSRAQQDGCQARVGLDWHGFELSNRGKAQPVCTGGVLYDIGRDTPTFVVLAYGRTWRSHGFTCRSRVTGLTCTNGHGHGLFLSRLTYRLW